jgi:deazaflavin-dependent oxidoreductase (nitroreductase family)
MSDANDFNQQVIEEFRRNGGAIARFGPDVKVLLLHHRGAKTGIERVNPLGYEPVGDGFAVLANNDGAPTHPDWYFNLSKYPETEVEVGNDRIRVVAREARGQERQDIWERKRSAQPVVFDEFERKASGHRQIPIMVLERRP